MTRATLRRNLRRTTFWLVLILVIALAVKLGEIGVIGTGEKPLIEYGKAIYEFIKDMAVVIVTIAAAWLAAILQRRSKFIESLEEEWRGIVRMKSKLFTYCERPEPNLDEYLSAFCALSETLDSMRLVYRNVGETNELVGLYAFAPLHDMRRAFRTLDPAKRTDFSESERRLVRDAIMQCFYALRENFLEELDLEEPQHPLLAYGSARAKQPGMTGKARAALEKERKNQDRLDRPRPDVDAFLHKEWLEEEERQKTVKSKP